MGDREIKSALEIAMEKTAKMPKLTPEELWEQKEKEYAPLGRVIANRYLENTLTKRDLKIELGRYKGQELEIVSKAFLLTLCQSIELDDAEKSKRAVAGIQILKPNGYLEEIGREIDKIYREFQQERQQRYDVFEKLERQKLEHLGIRGSAVKPDLEEKEDWRQELKRIQLICEPRIDELKEKLAHYIVA